MAAEKARALRAEVTALVERYGKRRAATIVGVGRTTLYRFLAGDDLEPRSRIKIADALARERQRAAGTAPGTAVAQARTPPGTPTGVARGTTASPSVPSPGGAPTGADGLHAPSYWRGRMERAAQTMTAIRALAETVDGDLRGLLTSGVQFILPAVMPTGPQTPNALADDLASALADLTDDELAPMLRAPSPQPTAAPRAGSSAEAAPRPRHRRKA